MDDVKPPEQGQWYTRANKANLARYADRKTDTLRIGKVDAAKERFEVERFDGWDTRGAVFGRVTWVSFETWRKEARRYSLREPVAPPEAAALAPPAEPTMADLKAEIAACRAEVAGLRGEVRALAEALKAAVPQMRLFPAAA